MRTGQATTALAVTLLVCGWAAAGYAAPHSAQVAKPTTTIPKPKTKSASSGSLSAKNRTKKTSVNRAPPRERAQMVPTPQRIKEIQSALARKGVFQGEPSGKWDAATVESMKQFQTSQRLNPTGKLDARTLEKLGLGSETAGRGAPLPLPGPEESAVGNSAQQQHP
jgi:peptidoglycan hydrolase-like protein with peptidoglycan-binding domain